jgi:hypothetical protein
LEESLSACLADEHTLIKCGLLPPNFLLARKLLGLGQRTVVSKHLAACRKVWRRKWIPIEEWITTIECGRTPDFDPGSLRGMNLPSCRVDLQWRRARALADAKPPGSMSANSRPPSEVTAAREKLLKDLKRQLKARVDNAIRYLDDEPPTG